MDANGIGTDATMAEHIEKIVERAYVIKHNLSGRKSLPVLIPSTLGIALVEGYDEIGFDKSLTKPFLRKDMEAAMKGICDGQMAKSDVIRTNLAMYREVFSIARRSESILVQAVCRYANNGPQGTTTTTSATNSSQSTRSRPSRGSEVPV
jgi:DNA topoisomerase-3